MGEDPFASEHFDHLDYMCLCEILPKRTRGACQKEKFPRARDEKEMERRVRLKKKKKKGKVIARKKLEQLHKQRLASRTHGQNPRIRRRQVLGLEKNTTKTFES